MNKITAFLIFAWIVAVVTAAYPTFVYSYPVLCGPRQDVLDSLERSFDEKIAERGIDEGLLVVITVNSDGKWSLLLTPKGRLESFCVPLTGTGWTQDTNSSKGITYNGSVLSMVYTTDGNWNMLYLDKTNGKIEEITTGYAWERVIDFNKLDN